MTTTDMPPTEEEPDPPAEPSHSPTPEEKPEPDPPKDGDAGYPADKAPADMTVEQQVAYWKDQSRRNERLWKSRAQKARDEADKLRREQMSDSEKALDAAKAEGRKAALQEVGTQLVEAEMKAQAAGKVAPELLDTLLAVADRSKFLNEDGGVDRDEIKKTIEGLSLRPATGAPTPDIGQGRRPPAARETARERGLAEARRRFGTAS